jgi:rubrerythrin
MDPYNYQLIRYEEDANLMKDVMNAINGEYSAIACYDQLAQMAPNSDQRNQILEIRQDEIHHYQEFSQLFMRLTGCQPTPQITEHCPNEYIAGLEFALRDEQETVDRYLTISDHAHDVCTKELFRRAAADEQNHAVWFLYFYTKNRF